MQLILIRHGDPDYEIDGLTEEGRAQVKALSEYLKPQRFDGVYSSPLGRAHLTAKACFDESEIVVLDWLKEFDHRIKLKDGTEQGGWDFMPAYFCSREDFYSAERYLSAPEMRSGEIKKYYDEVTAGLDGLLKKYGYEREGRYYRVTDSNRKKVVLFCHFGVTCVLLSHLMGASHLVLAQHLCASPSSITTLATEERQKGIAQFRCLSFGATPHLIVKGMEPSFSARFCEVFDSPDRH